MNNKIAMNIRESVTSILSNKARSVLTMMGIIIGISAVIIMIGLGKGAQQLLVDQVKSLGSNIVFVLAGGDGGQRRGPPAAARGIVTKTLTFSDVDMLEQKSSTLGIKNLSSYTSSLPTTIKLEGKDDVNINVQGRDRHYFISKNSIFEEGGLWNEKDEKSLGRVAIIGGGAKEKIYGKDAGQVAGKRLKVKNNNYEIVGVLKKKGAGIAGAFGQDDDTSIIIPTKTMMNIVLGIDYLFGIQMEIISEAKDDTEVVIKKVEDLLRKAHHLRSTEENDFSVRAQADAIAIFTTITDAFTIFLALIASISLLVGGIGIMNIMLVTVTERTFEIGLRKALGAKRTDILVQFLIEGIVLTALGGIVGVSFGILVTFGLSLIGGWAFTIDPWAILLATGVSITFGLIFGMYPANRASKLDPIEALRYE